MKKIINTTITVIITLAIVCVGIAIYMHFTKSDEKQEINAVDPAVIYSEKYGTFNIPDGNMFATFGYGANVGFPNNTDLYYINEYITGKFNKVNGTDYSNLNFAYSVYGSGSETYLKDNAMRVFDTGSLYYHFSDNILKYDTTHNDVIFGFMIGSFIAVSEDFTTFPIEYGNAPNVPKESILIDGQTAILSLHARVLAKKITIEMDNITTTMYAPMVIISDKGVPLTDEIYKEITGKNI